MSHTVFISSNVVFCWGGEMNSIGINALNEKPGPEVIKLFPCSIQLSTNFILLLNVKMPTIFGILTFISMINIQNLRGLKQETSSFVGMLVFMSS